MPRHANTPTAPERSSKSARVRALLAGGLVLGIGIPATTLAAWTDSEYLTTSVGTSRFDLESRSASAPTFASHVNAAGALALGMPGGFSPGASRFAYADFRTSTDSTVGGTVQLTGQTITVTSGAAFTAGDLSYRIASVAATASCDATTMAAATTWLGSTAGAFTAIGQVGTTNLTVPVAAAAATPVRLCVEARLSASAPSSYQGRSFDLAWVFTGTSAS